MAKSLNTRLKREFYPELEGLRGVAILLVIISHFIIVPNFTNLHFLKFGFWGVNLFFVLSGFLISEILMLEIEKGNSTKIIFKNFYIRRTLRIFPIYYLTLFVLYLFDVGNTKVVILYTITYTYNLANVWNNVYSEHLTHIWSLCVEEQFYLFWPFLLVLIPNKYQLTLILSMILIGFGSRFIYAGFKLPNYCNFIWSTPACLDCLGLGALLAWMKLYKRILLEKLSRFYFIPLALSLLFWYISKSAHGVESSLLFVGVGRLLVGLTGFSLVAIAATGQVTYYGKIINRNWLKFIGRISYGLYVYHWILYVLLNDKIKIWVLPYLNKNNFFLSKLYYNFYLISFFVLSALSILVALISYKFIEKPLLRLKGRF